jgi:hypothetical protein
MLRTPTLKPIARAEGREPRKNYFALKMPIANHLLFVRLIGTPWIGAADWNTVDRGEQALAFL